MFSNIINGIYQEGDNKLYDFHSKITEMVSVNGKKTKIEKKDISKKEEKPIIGNSIVNNKGNSMFGVTQDKPNSSSGGLNQPSVLFGNSNNNQPSGGLFGGTSNNNNKPSSIFGGVTNNNNQQSSLFGSSNNNKPSSGLFGGGNTNINQPSGLFGSSNNNQQSSLFGEQKSPLFGTGNTHLEAIINKCLYLELKVTLHPLYQMKLSLLLLHQNLLYPYRTITLLQLIIHHYKLSFIVFLYPKINFYISHQ